MIVIEYKIACEINIIHDYYLIGKDHNSFFSLTPADQAIVLGRKLQAGQYDVSQDLRLLVGTKDAQILSNYKMRILRSPLGFKLAIEVNSVKGPGDTVRYRPVIPLPSDLCLWIGLAPVNSLFGNITNVRLHEPDQLVYLFSNEGVRIAGTLSNPVPALEGRNYQMGEHARIDGTNQEAIEDNAGDRSKFERIAGQGFVNEADRTLDKTSAEYKNWKQTLAGFTGRPLGVIDLKFYTAQGDQAIVDSEGFLVTRRNAGERRPVTKKFELRFLSKRTYWRYAKKEGFSSAEVDRINLKASSFLAFQDKKFVSRKPRFVSRSLTNFDDGIVTFPNPTPNSLKREGKKMFSDVYFNKVNPIP